MGAGEQFDVAFVVSGAVCGVAGDVEYWLPGWGVSGCASFDEPDYFACGEAECVFGCVEERAVVHVAVVFLNDVDERLAAC